MHQHTGCERRRRKKKSRARLGNGSENGTHHDIADEEGAKRHASDEQHSVQLSELYHQDATTSKRGVKTSKRRATGHNSATPHLLVPHTHMLILQCLDEQAVRNTSGLLVQQFLDFHRQCGQPLVLLVVEATPREMGDENTHFARR